MKHQQMTASDHHHLMDRYVLRGEQRASRLGNRGPIKFDSAGRLAPEIIDAYASHGFYVFENLVDAEEINLLRTDYAEILERAPVDNTSELDRQGRRAMGMELARRPYSLIRPLSDPWGGTAHLNGRHPVKMSEPSASADAPARVPFLISSMCQMSEAGFRLYGHPQILAIAQAINGEDFVPYNDTAFVKLPGLGGSVSWHQDGVTHWDSPNWDEGIHGFNFQVQLYPSTIANCLWVMPGTHKLGRVDIKALVAEHHGSDQLPGAVPLTCKAGDVTIVNRQMLHGSFANTSADIRVSMTFGFHRRRSVLGARGALTQKSSEVYDAQRIFQRSSVIAVAIDARAQHYPAERRYQYQPFIGLEDEYRYSNAMFEQVIRDYNLKDLSI